MSSASMPICSRARGRDPSITTSTAASSSDSCRRPFVCPEVEGDRLGATVERIEERRRVPCPVGAGRALDVDHPCAEASEHIGGERPRPQRRQVDDGRPVQRTDRGLPELLDEHRSGVRGATDSGAGESERDRLIDHGLQVPVSEDGLDHRPWIGTGQRLAGDTEPCRYGGDVVRAGERHRDPPVGATHQPCRSAAADRSGSVAPGSVGSRWAETEQCGPLGKQADTLGGGDRSKPGTVTVEVGDESGDGTHQPGRDLHPTGGEPLAARFGPQRGCVDVGRAPTQRFEARCGLTAPLCCRCLRFGDQPSRAHPRRLRRVHPHTVRRRASRRRRPDHDHHRGARRRRRARRHLVRCPSWSPGSVTNSAARAR